MKRWRVDHSSANNRVPPHHCRDLRNEFAYQLSYRANRDRDERGELFLSEFLIVIPRVIIGIGCIPAGGNFWLTIANCNARAALLYM